MAEQLRPSDEAELTEAVRWALSAGRTLELVGGGTKRALGRAIQTDATLDLSGLSGITLYEPEELVLSARAGTPMSEIAEAVAGCGQMLAFEPMDYGPLLGEPQEGRAFRVGTLGGTVACNLSGPRRPSAGAARDHMLGLRAVSGRGEAFKAGGRVVKNVTGYDLPRGLSGSYGTLAAFSEITLKVLPRPETEETLLLAGLDDATAARAMSAAVGSQYDVSGAAHLPASVAARVASVADCAAAVTVFRLEGVPPSIRHRRARLEALLGGFGTLGHLEADGSAALWTAIRDALPFAAGPHRRDGAGDTAVWRVSTAPMQGPAIGAAAAALGAEVFYDWAGGLVWLAMPDGEPRAAAVRAAVASTGGHATLVRASPARRASLDVFEPLDSTTTALVRRMKDGFDPNRVLNPGRIYAGV